MNKLSQIERKTLIGNYNYHVSCCGPAWLTPDRSRGWSSRRPSAVGTNVATVALRAVAT